jgi:hypothetical protein
VLEQGELKPFYSMMRQRVCCTVILVKVQPDESLHGFDGGWVGVRPVLTTW